MMMERLLFSANKFKAIAFQNDAFRSEIGGRKYCYPAINGKCVVSMDISALPREQLEEIVLRTRDFNGFDKYMDPTGEHKQGRFYYSDIGKDVVWEIHYQSMTKDKVPSEDPSDPTKTYRDLRIALEPRS